MRPYPTRCYALCSIQKRTINMANEDDDDLEWHARERDPAFLASLAQAREDVSQGNTISHADLKKSLGLD